MLLPRATAKKLRPLASSSVMGIIGSSVMWTLPRWGEDIKATTRQDRWSRVTTKRNG